MNGEAHLSLDSVLWTSYIFQTSQGVPLQAAKVHILHTCALWCSGCAGVAWSLTKRPKSISCIETQIKSEINSNFLYEPLQVLYVQMNSMALLCFKLREIPNLKGRYTSSRDIPHKQQQDRSAKSERLSASKYHLIEIW